MPQNNVGRPRVGYQIIDKSTGQKEYSEGDKKVDREMLVDFIA